MRQAPFSRLPLEKLCPIQCLNLIIRQDMTIYLLVLQPFSIQQSIVVQNQYDCRGYYYYYYYAQWNRRTNISFLSARARPSSLSHVRPRPLFPPLDIFFITSAQNTHITIWDWFFLLLLQVSIVDFNYDEMS